MGAVAAVAEEKEEETRRADEGKGKAERWWVPRGSRGPGVKSKVKGSCGRRRVVAVKAVTRRVQPAAAS